MTDAPVLRSRPTRALAPVPASEAGAQLDVTMRRAQTVAAAGDTIPKSYRGRPGAVLLADEWARSRGLDLLTALQTVAFIDGKPVIDATMQRALAKQAGYRVKVVDASMKAATVEVWEGDELLGAATYTIEEASTAGLTGKKNWQQNPKAMLVARATTQAIRWHAPDVMTGVFTADELDEPLDVLAAPPGEVVGGLDGSPSSAGERTGSNPAPDADSSPGDGIVDAEIVEPEPAPQVEVEVGAPITPAQIGEVMAAIERAKSDGRWPEIATQVQGENIPLVVARMTGDQAARVLELIDTKETQQ